MTRSGSECGLLLPQPSNQGSRRAGAALVVGESLVARALAGALELFYGPAESVAQLSDPPPNLELYTRIVYLAEGADPALSALRLVFRLRDDLTWTGGLVVVVPSAHDKGRLDETVLAEGPSSRITFGAAPGHVSVARPGVLVGVLCALHEVTSLPYGTWLRIQDASKTSVLLEQLQAVEGRVSRGDPVDRSALVVLVDTFASIDWRPLLIDPHRDLARVTPVRERVERSMKRSTPDPAAVATAIRECLSITWLRSRT